MRKRGHGAEILHELWHAITVRLRKMQETCKHNGEILWSLRDKEPRSLKPYSLLGNSRDFAGK
jgi:hypothetical protein